MKGSLIVFTVERTEKGVSSASYSAFYRKLYRYNKPSHCGKYHSRVPGFLNRIGYIKHTNGVILLMKEKSRSVVEYLKENSAKVFQWKMELSKMGGDRPHKRKHQQGRLNSTYIFVQHNTLFWLLNFC